MHLKKAPKEPLCCRQPHCVGNETAAPKLLLPMDGGLGVRGWGSGSLLNSPPPRVPLTARHRRHCPPLFAHLAMNTRLVPRTSISRFPTFLTVLDLPESIPSQNGHVFFVRHMFHPRSQNGVRSSPVSGNHLCSVTDENAADIHLPQSCRGAANLADRMESR